MAEPEQGLTIADNHFFTEIDCQNLFWQSILCIWQCYYSLFAYFCTEKMIYIKTMKTKLSIIALLLISVTATWAQDATQRLVVWQKSGEKVYFALSEEPETTFDDGKLVIKTTKTTVYYQLENVLRYTYEGTIDAIDGPKLRPGEVIFRQGVDQMAFDGLADGTRLTVYALDGKQLQTITAHGGQQTVVSLAGQPAGTYIVKIGDATFKFVKR